MEISLSVVLQALIGAGAGAFGAYVAIRRVEVLHSATDKAHSRIDQILNK